MLMSRCASSFFLSFFLFVFVYVHGSRGYGDSTDITKGVRVFGKGKSAELVVGWDN